MGCHSAPGSHLSRIVRMAHCFRLCHSVSSVLRSCFFFFATTNCPKRWRFTDTCIVPYWFSAKLLRKCNFCKRCRAPLSISYKARLYLPRCERTHIPWKQSNMFSNASTEKYLSEARLSQRVNTHLNYRGYKVPVWLRMSPYWMRNCIPFGLVSALNLLLGHTHTHKKNLNFVKVESWSWSRCVAICDEYVSSEPTFLVVFVDGGGKVRVFTGPRNELTRLH